MEKRGSCAWLGLTVPLCIATTDCEIYYEYLQTFSPNWFPKSPRALSSSRSKRPRSKCLYLHETNVTQYKICFSFTMFGTELAVTSVHLAHLLGKISGKVIANEQSCYGAKNFVKIVLKMLLRSSRNLSSSGWKINKPFWSIQSSKIPPI